MKISWVTIDRSCQEEADVKEDVRRELERTGKPLRSSADPLSDDELLAKLRDLGLDIDRDGMERLCAGALSAEEAARPILDKLVSRERGTLTSGHGRRTMIHGVDCECGGSAARS